MRALGWALRQVARQVALRPLQIPASQVWVVLLVESVRRLEGWSERPYGAPLRLFCKAFPRSLEVQRIPVTQNVPDERR